MLRGWRIWVVGVLVTLVAWDGDSGFAQSGRHGELAKMVDGSPIITVLPTDAIPAIDAPTFVSAREADRMMQPDEPILGVTDGKVAKAYSLWQLNHHEIVNDQLGTLPIAVTW
jgi:hypothetical protein